MKNTRKNTKPAAKRQTKPKAPAPARMSVLGAIDFGDKPAVVQQQQNPNIDRAEEVAEKVLGQPVGRELTAQVMLDSAVDGMIEPYFRLFEQYTADVGRVEIEGPDGKPQTYVLGSLLDLTGPQMEGAV